MMILLCCGAWLSAPRMQGRKPRGSQILIQFCLIGSAFGGLLNTFLDGTYKSASRRTKCRIDCHTDSFFGELLRQNSKFWADISVWKLCRLWPISSCYLSEFPHYRTLAERNEQPRIKIFGILYTSTSTIWSEERASSKEVLRNLDGFWKFE